MPSEEFDHRAKEAAENHHPLYDEKAWDKMEKLLNKHLPQKREGDRKKILLILLFLLFLGSGAYLLFNKSGKAIRQPSASSVVPPVENKQAPSTADPAAQSGELAKENKVQPPDENKIQPVDANKIQPGQEARQRKVQPVNTTNTQTDKTNSPRNLADQAVVSPTKGISKKNSAVVNSRTKKELIPPVNNAKTKPVDAVSKKVNSESDPFDANKSELTALATKKPERPDPSTDQPQSANKQTSLQQEPKPANLQNDQAVLDKKAENSVAVQPTPEVPAKKEPGPKPTTPARQKKARITNNGFLFTASAGPDISATGTKLGSVEAAYGAGIGYTLNRWTLRTGIYSSRKVYGASPYAYHPPDYFWTYYPDLQWVNADCRVTEIPVTLSYDFSRSKKSALMGTLGLSSYLMKRETYDYIYKNSSGQVLNWVATMRNQNKHYFTVLTIGGAYERKINNTLSFMVEPYVKLPLTGVGYGKVDLNSAGILFTLGIRPFHSAAPGKRHE